MSADLALDALAWICGEGQRDCDGQYWSIDEDRLLRCPDFSTNPEDWCNCCVAGAAWFSLICPEPEEPAMPEAATTSAPEVVYVQPVCDGKWGWDCPCGASDRLPRATKREPYATWRRRALIAAAEHGQDRHRGIWAIGPDKVTVNSLNAKDLKADKKAKGAA